jgi:hypothetical protein
VAEKDLGKEVATGKRGHSHLRKIDFVFFVLGLSDAFICFFPAGWVACAGWLQCCTTQRMAFRLYPSLQRVNTTAHKRGQQLE